MIKYHEEIKESEAEVLAVERRQSRSKLRDRVRLLRLLKSGSSRSLTQASVVIGLSVAQTRRLYDKYRQGGLQELLAWRQGGNHQKLNPAQQAELIERSKAGFTSQQAVREYLQQTFNVTYTQGGVSVLLARLKIKLKTARPRHREKDEGAADAFKKNLQLPTPISPSISRTR